MPTLALQTDFSSTDVVKNYLIRQSRETIRNLTRLAENTRQTSRTSKGVNFLDTFFKPAKQHIL
jgi:hypothetical protein